MHANHRTAEDESTVEDESKGVEIDESIARGMTGAAGLDGRRRPSGAIGARAREVTNRH
jgi:hypothetical protein